MRLPYETTNRSSPSNFVPDLILQEAWTRDDLTHQRMVAEMDPIASYLIRSLSGNCFDDWFRFIDPVSGKEIMLDIQARLRELGAQQNFIQCLITERTYGWCWQFLGRERLREDDTTTVTPQVINLDFFSPIDAKPVMFDEMGLPTVIEVSVSSTAGTIQNLRFPVSDFVLWRTRPFDRSYMGRPCLYGAWDLLVYIRLILHSLAFYASKVGLGVFRIMVKGAVSDEVRAAIEAMAQDLSTKRAAILDEDMYSSLDFIGAQGSPVDFVGMIDSLLGMASASLGVPKATLTGAFAGTISGSETNLKELAQCLNSIQTSVEPFIRQDVKAMGHVGDYKIAWNVKFNPNPVEQAQVDQAKATELVTLSKILTINELRQRLGYSPLPDGDRLSEDVRVNVSGLQSQEEQSVTNNPSGVNI